MGTTIRIKGTKFKTLVYTNNSYTWGAGGITRFGATSGSANGSMSTKNAGFATKDILLKASNGYELAGVLKNTEKSNTKTDPNYSFIQFDVDEHVTKVVIPAGYYYEVSIRRIDVDGENADLSEAPQSLLVASE